MSADVETESVRITNKNRRILIRRTLISAAVILGALIGYSVYLVVQFQSLVSTFQKQRAQLLLINERDAGKLEFFEYGSAPGHAFIPRPFINYQRSVNYVEWKRHPKSSPEEIDELFSLLPDFHKLKYLVFTDFRIDRNRAAALARIPRLKTIYFTGCQFDSSTLNTVLQIEGLKFLSLADSTFQEEELSTLTQGSLKENLTQLNLSNCQITDRTAAVLSECRNLETLQLDGTQITDRGLKMLARLPHLKVLVLDHTAVTDDGVRYLTGTRELVELSLSNTGVSDEVVDVLKQEIPALRISDD
ncbi:leucine-rich repeat domain-containing protein [Gimesia sp.]|uniref:leucine-rich repeat domain-containing protein n=1 Tax=Gimesia sp. TaxID=2024833 RepID=UPI003A92ECED